MNTFNIWIAIAVLGAILYIWPVFAVRRMYEGFNAQPPQVAQQLAQIERLLGSATATPSITAPTVQNQPVGASGAVAQPEPTARVRSQPASTAEIPAEETEALDQGKSFQATKPKLAPAPRVIVERVPYPVPRRCPRRDCPNVVCPDMRDYIRKDSIPCWACKLS